MEFKSKIHGNIKYSEDDIFTFKRGIPGFDNLKKFILVNLGGYEPFKLLHSLESDELGIILISPFDVIKEYEIKIPDDVINNLGIKDSSEVMLLNTVTLNSKVENITTNLKAPLVINIKTKLGEQIIVDDMKYSIKHPIV